MLQRAEARSPSVDYDGGLRQVDRRFSLRLGGCGGRWAQRAASERRGRAAQMCTAKALRAALPYTGDLEQGQRGGVAMA